MTSHVTATVSALNPDKPVNQEDISIGVILRTLLLAVGNDLHAACSPTPE